MAIAADTDPTCCFVPRGDWDLVAIYSPLDLVTHSGSSYIALLSNVGTEPTFYSTTWMLLASKGDTAELNPRGTWQKSIVYNRLDVVSYQGSSWIARKESIGRAPAESQFWMLLAERGPGGGGSLTISSGGGTGLHNDLTDVTPNQHHAQLHDQADHDRAEAGDIAAVAAAGAAGTSLESPNADHVHAHGSGYAGGHTDGGFQNLFVQPTAPVTSEPTYLWVQTEIGANDDWSFWFEDAV